MTTTATTNDRVEFDLDDIGEQFGLPRRDGEDDEAFASRLHYHFDALIRDHAQDILRLMDAHHYIEMCFPTGETNDRHH